MKIVSLKLIAFLFFLLCLTHLAQSQIWSENFNSYADGTTIAPGMWTSYATDCDDGAAFNTGPGISQWGVWGGQFTINDIEGAPCCQGGIEGGGNDNAWTTDIIDISEYCDVDIALQTSQSGNMECDSPGAPIFGCTGGTPPDNSHDQIVAEYQVDGGGWVQFGYVCATNGLGLLSVGGINGNNLEIRVFAANKSNTEYYYFDDVVVNGTMAVTPTFTQIGPLCEDEAPFGLPNVSLEGITGTWDVGSAFNPNGLGGTTTTITFTPAAGQCAGPTTMDIVVNEISAPPIVLIGPYCELDPPVNLPTNTGGITGNWAGPGVTANVFDPGANTGSITIFFNPDPGQCVGSATYTFPVIAAETPNMITANTLCQMPNAIDLTTYQDPAHPNGTWSGPGVVGNMFTLTNTVGGYSLIFQSDEPCTNPVTVTIGIVALVPPYVLTTAEICESGGVFDLTTLLPAGAPSGNWMGLGVNGTTLDPTGLNGVINIDYSPGVQCGQSSTTTVTVVPSGTLNLAVATVCQNDPPFDLTALQDPLHPGGTWSGPGVAGNLFSPAGLVGNIILLYTPNTPCVQPETTTITVELAGTPTLGSTNVCEIGGPFDLTTLQDPLFPTGTWSGPNVAGNTFIPSGLSGTINMTFTPDGTCVLPAVTTITIVEPEMPTLGTAILCETNGPFNLNTLNDPAFPAGTWAGPGVSGTTFSPAGQSGDVILTFTPTSDCALPATTTITVNVPSAPILGTASVCESTTTFDLTTLEDPTFPTGAWSGPGVSGTLFVPIGQSGDVMLTFTPDTDCSLPAQTTVTVNEAPTFSNLTDDCDPATQTYTISFDISGGTPPYTVDGTIVTGATFISTSIPSGTPYSFRLESEGIPVFMTDHLTIDTDPLVSNAIGGVKLKVYTEDKIRAQEVLNSINEFSLNDEGEAMVCPNCQSTEVDYFSNVNSLASLGAFLIGFLFGSLPFYNKYDYRCRNCKNKFLAS